MHAGAGLTGAYASKDDEASDAKHHPNPNSPAASGEKNGISFFSLLFFHEFCVFSNVFSEGVR